MEREPKEKKEDDDAISRNQVPQPPTIKVQKLAQYVQMMKEGRHRDQDTQN
jgi:hypothetical protein